MGGMDLLMGTYKGVTMSLAEFPDAVSIYSVESSNPDKGECQEAILELKKKYETVYASIPLNPKIKHIFDKLLIIYKE